MNSFLISIINNKNLIQLQLFERMSHIAKNKVNNSSDVSFKLLDAIPNIDFNKFLSILFPVKSASYSWKHLKDFAFCNYLLTKYITAYISQDLFEKDDSYPRFMDDIFVDSIWTEKYSPRNSGQILSNKDQAEDIINWLNKWKIGKVELPTVSVSEVSEETNKRGRKKKNVDSTYHPEDDIFMGYYDYSPVNYYNSLFSSSTVETKDDKFLYLVGPPASGKSSTIQACALECGFEILEIYPGIKRSGKDITNIIGDLTQSHTVSQMSSDKSLHSPKRKNSLSMSSLPHSTDNSNNVNADLSAKSINTNTNNPNFDNIKNEEDELSEKKESSTKGD